VDGLARLEATTSYKADGQGDVLTVTASLDPGTGVIFVVLCGELTLDSAPTVRHVLLKCFAESPDAVIVDLTELRTDTQSYLAVFRAAIHAQTTPPVALLLCGASPELSATMGRQLGDLTVYDTREHALAAACAAQVHPPRRVSMSLAPTLAAPATAREMVDAACRSWHIEHVGESAMLVVSELVSNAVKHAGTDMHLTAVLRANHLHLTVRDGSPHPPVATGFDVDDALPMPEDGRGLYLINIYATAWGSIPTNGGKTVWATLRISPAGG
jgi:anti-anti-sigma regulatory factor